MAPSYRLIGERRAFVRDSYHSFLRASWPMAIARLAGAGLGANLLFAVLYFFVGGIANARPGDLRDDFYFSVQTFGTIGYGSMYPTTDAANLVVVVESLTGTLMTAVATGLLFAKFGRTQPRLRFGELVAVGPHDGVPTLMLRIGNERDNTLIDAQFRVTFVRTELTREGATYYRMYDLPLARSHTAALTRAYTLMHAIDETSPLHGYDAARLAKDEAELHLLVTGTDDTSLQLVHGTRVYTDQDFRFGTRPADMLTFEPDGTIVVDLGKFDALVPVAPGEG